MAYIYQIINDINDKIYIGKTERSIEERWNEQSSHPDQMGRSPKTYYFLNECGPHTRTLYGPWDCQEWSPHLQ